MNAKFWFLVCSLLLGLSLPLGPAWAAKPEVKLISQATLKGMLGDPDPLIIDMRQGDWCSRHQIAGARRYAPEEITSWAPRLPRDKKIVVYCSCPFKHTSARVAQQ